MSQKVEYNAVQKDVIWRARIKAETDANLSHNVSYGDKAKRENMDFWNKTQTNVIFNGSGYKLDYETTNTKAYGPRQQQFIEEMIKLEYPENYFIPDIGYSTTNGESYGYGDIYKQKGLNLQDSIGK